MEQLEEDFIPDFTQVAAVGLICNRDSMVRHADGMTYISARNRIDVWDTKKAELLRSIENRRSRVTYLDVVDELLLVGYDNGIVEIHSGEITALRPHSRRVTKIAKLGDYVISASADGGIVAYDLIKEEVRTFYKGGGACIDTFTIGSGEILAVCGDNAVRTWEIGDQNVKDVHVFERGVKEVVAEEGEWIVFFRDGEYAMYSPSSREAVSCGKFKKLRSVKRKGSRVYLHCKKKIHILEVEKRDRLILRNVDLVDVSDRHIDFDCTGDGDMVFIGNDNSWETYNGKQLCSFSYHRSEIRDVRICGDKIVSLSKERVMFWLNDGEALSRIGGIVVEDAENMCIWDGLVVVGGSRGFTCYSMINYDAVAEMEVGKIHSCSSSRELLMVCTERKVSFYSSDLRIVNELETGGVITHVAMARDMSLFCVSLLDGRVYLYDYGAMSLRIVLYGHSLPVRHMAFSPDSSTLLTCGTDKVLKMWGTQFGECRKTIIGDASNAEYLTNDLFMFGAETIKYYRKHALVKDFKRVRANVVRVADETMVSCDAFEIRLFHMNRYELEPEESSEEEEIMREVRVASLRKYDRFLDELEMVDREFSDQHIKRLYATMGEVNFCELDEYMVILSSSNISRIIDVLDVCYDINVVLTARVFISLTKLHKEVCVSHGRFKAILARITTKIGELRNEIAMNEGLLLVQRSIAEEDLGY
jgi:U3 small nucleolar RNA-associated protein 12